MSTYNKIDDLEFICEEYLNYVFDEMYPDKNIVEWDNDIDWWRHNFGFVATNNYHIGYDIKEWFDNIFDNETMKKVFNNSSNIFGAIHYINSWYENTYGRGECIMDWNELCETHLLRQYAYVYCEEELEGFIGYRKELWDEETKNIEIDNEDHDEQGI
jgi:hypothetical protein